MSQYERGSLPLSGGDMEGQINWADSLTATLKELSGATDQDLNIDAEAGQEVVIGVAGVEGLRVTDDDAVIVNAGALIVGAGEAGTTAATGNTLRAADIATGGAGDIAGADLTIAAGLGTGTGDVGQLIFQTPRVAAAGDNIQTLSTLVTLDGNDVGILEDDATLSIGGAGDAKFLWETADANANALLIALPDGGATNVPVVVVGDKGGTSVVNADLALFNGVVDPTIAVLDQTNADYISMSHDGTNGIVTTNNGDLILNPGGADVTLVDDTALGFGTANDARLQWETADTSAHYLSLAISSVSRNFIISEDVGVDWGHAASTNPTVFIHSADATDTADWLSLAHDQSNAVISTGRGGISLDGGVVFKRTASAAGNYTILVSDYYVGKTGITGGGDTVTLPAIAGVTTGQVFILKDEAGGAATNNITLDGSGAETIDGAATAVISSNYGAITVMFNGTEWSII